MVGGSQNQRGRSKLYIYTGVNGVSCTADVVRFGTLACVVPGFGVAALGRLRGLGECVSEESVPRSRITKRRRANRPAGSKKRRDLWVTAAEEAALVARAAREKVTVPNLLISAALSEGAETPTERKAAVAELMAIHTLLARVSNNVNQIARHANAGDEFPQDAKAALAYVREVAVRIDRTIEGLM